MTVVDDVKSRLDILEVVSQRVALHRAGRSYRANCPFHQERTPSFYVFPDRQTWRCFGACADGGDLISFVMRAENLEFAEALKRLAQQAGVELPSRRRRSQQDAAFQINEAARGYFQQVLASREGAGARAYLDRRGLSAGSVQAFELGLSPRDGESLKNHLVGQGYSPQQMVEAGLVRVSENGQARDLFRGRLMIPIRNSQAELSGFGGRTLDEATPKYLNSPRSPVFDKGRLLYGLHLAREGARQKGLVVVEGYMDVIAAHEHGFDNVVASMGTALTEHQVAAIQGVTDSVVMALDPDAAGQQATLRSLESSWRAFQHQEVGRSRGITLYRREGRPEPRVAVLPPGEDPDQVIRRSPEEWARLVENAMPLMDYWLVTRSAQLDLTTPQGKAQMAEEMFQLIAAVPEATRQDHYFQALAAHLGVTEETLRATVGRPQAVRRDRRTGSRGRVATPSPFAKLDSDPVEDYCLATLLQHQDLDKAAGDLRPEYFRRPENREIFSRWARECERRRDGSPMDESQAGVDDELAEHLDSLLKKTLPPLDVHRRLPAFQAAVHRLEERYLRDLKAEEEIRFAEAPPELLEQLHQEVLEVNQRLKSNQERRNRLSQEFSQRGL